MKEQLEAAMADIDGETLTGSGFEGETPEAGFSYSPVGVPDREVRA